MITSNNSIRSEDQLWPTYSAAGACMAGTNARLLFEPARRSRAVAAVAKSGSRTRRRRDVIRRTWPPARARSRVTDLHHRRGVVRLQYDQQSTGAEPFSIAAASAHAGVRDVSAATERHSIARRQRRSPRRRHGLPHARTHAHASYTFLTLIVLPSPATKRVPQGEI